MTEKNKNVISNMVLTVLFFGWITSYIDRTAISLSLVQIGHSLSLNASRLGLVLSAFFMGYAIMQIPGGWLADRFGARKVIVIAVLCWSLFTALTGLTWSLTSLILIRFLFGIGEGAYPSASTKTISDYFPIGRRVKAQSTMMSSNSLGSALAPIICAPLLVWLGWRNVFLMISLLGIIIVVWFLLCTKGSGLYANQNTSENTVRPNMGEYKKLLRNPYLWKVLLIFFFVNITSWGLNSWMPTYLMQVQGVDLKSVGIISAIPALAGSATMFISGPIIQKIGSNSKFFVIIGTLFLGAGLYLLSNSSSIFIVIITQCFIAIFSSFIIAFVFTLPHRISEKQVVGTAFGMLNFGGQAAGIFSPMIMGALISASGGSYKTAFIFLTGCALVATVIGFLLPSTKSNQVVVENVVS